MSLLKYAGAAGPAGLLVAIAAPARAQTAPAPAARATPAAAQPPAGTWLAAAGTDLNAWDHVLGRSMRGVAVQLGYERRVGRPGSPFALRVAGEYWRSGGGTFAPFNPADPANPYTFRRTTATVGGSVLGVVRLPALGPVRPYALGGVGVYQYSGRNEARLPGGATAVYQPGDRATSFAWSAGLGASMQVGPVTPYVELRHMWLGGFESTNVSGERAPLTFGVRLSF
jgi:opacity protein-like surface antigen